MADQGAEGLLSPFLRECRIKATSPFLRGCVLDIGCGAGSLASLVDPELYYGFDYDEESISIARRRFPRHKFQMEMPKPASFDTVVSLAVIEHVPQPDIFLKNLCRYLQPNRQSRIVLTTPHPSLEWVHDVGAKLGLFSAHASEEHETLLDKSSLQHIAQIADCPILIYKRFLLGANQMIVLSPEFTSSSSDSKRTKENVPVSASRNS